MMLILTALLLTSAVVASGEDDVQNMEAGVQCGPYTRTTCGVNSRCVNTNGFNDCICQDGFYGSGYIGCTSEPECVEDSVCAEDEVCRDNLCQNVCMNSCPADAGCIAKAHEAMCLDVGDLWFNEEE